MDQEYGKLKLAGTDGTRTATNYRAMIVERKQHITAGLPAQSGAYRVEYLDAEQLADRYKKLRKEFAILVPFPMVNNGQRVQVAFNVYWFSYRKGSFNYSLEGGSHVYFRYDCEKREFVIDEVMLWGV